MLKRVLTAQVGWLVLVSCGCGETGSMLGAVRGGTGAGSMGPAGMTSVAGAFAAGGGAGSLAVASAAGAAAVSGDGAGKAGDSSSTLGSGGASGSVTGSGSAGEAGGAAAATFARVWDQVIVAKGCTASYCHGQGQSQGGLSMGNKSDAFKNLVNISAAGPACQASGKVRVKPLDPGASLLMDKLSRPTPSCGDMMPIGTKLAPACVSTAPTVCTTEAEIGLVKDWIMSGAMND